MKAVCYLRLAQGARGYTFEATSKPSENPLTDTRGYALITRQFKLVLDLPESAFSPVDGEVQIDVGADLIEPVVQAVAEAP